MLKAGSEMALSFLFEESRLLLINRDWQTHLESQHCQWPS
jgi:hypothetical protein